MDRRIYALTSVILGLALGLIGNIFFYSNGIGVSFPLYILLVAAALFGFAAFARQRPRLRNLWLLIPLAFFAVMVAVRADQDLTFLNGLAVLAIGTLIAYYFPLREAVDQQPLTAHVTGMIETGFVSLFTPIGQLVDSMGWIRENRPLHHSGTSSVLRGLLIAVPVLFVFGLLLVSADEVFAQYMNQITSVFQITRLDAVMLQSFLICTFAWVTCGGLAYAVIRRVDNRYVQIGDQPAAEIKEESAQPKGKKRMLTLGVIESSIVLGSVVLLFGAFVLVQFAYFFGGEGNISQTGYTYSTYARRGFFELVAVSLMTLGLILWFDYVTVRQNTRQHTIFRALALGIVALTGVMLWSAHLRLSLYEEAYGFTHLRLYPHVFMLWLAVLYGFFVLTLFRVRENIFSFGVVICMIGYLATLNLINMDNTIMGQNISRYRSGHELDIGYLRNVSVDAVPVLLPFYLESDDRTLTVGIGQWLARKLIELERQQANRTLLSAHQSRDTAWALLNAARDRLPEYDPGYVLPYYSDPR